MANNPPLNCNVLECTLAQTGQCVLDHDPETCEERLKSLLTDLGDLTTTTTTIKPPVSNIKHFLPSYTFSVEQVQRLMEAKYCRIIGILGTPGTGKTACLVSLYLMLAHKRLDGFEFRDSKTIMAFEEICRGARTWSETDPPEDITVHTEILDERNAGFLHLRLEEKTNGQRFDFLLPDLPGEWTNALIDQNRSDRMSFLNAAECIWLMVNGQDIQNSTTRHATIHRLNLLIQRLDELLGDNKPGIVLVVTHKDKFQSVAALLQKVVEFGLRYQFSITVTEIASFSDDATVAAGTGIAELFQEITLTKDKESVFWPETNNHMNDRQMMNFGKQR